MQKLRNCGFMPAFHDFSFIVTSWIAYFYDYSNNSNKEKEIKLLFNAIRLELLAILVVRFKVSKFKKNLN